MREADRFRNNTLQRTHPLQRITLISEALKIFHTVLSAERKIANRRQSEL